LIQCHVAFQRDRLRRPSCAILMVQGYQKMDATYSAKAVT